MNIVRRIELIKTCNRKKEDDDKYDFVALGDFDYVNQRNISKEKMTISSLWKDMVDAYEIEELCNINRQIYYLVCSPEYKGADTALWSANNLEFYIISLMHVTNDINNDLINELNKRLCGIGVCYVTLNNCDLICVIKIRDYKKGLSKLQELSKIVNFTYTFSIPFFPPGFNNKECVIKKAIIHFNFKMTTDIVINRLKDNFKPGALLQKLGHDDYAIELIDENLSDILSYLQNDGVFACDSETKGEYIFSTRTYLYVDDEIIINNCPKQRLNNDNLISMIEIVKKYFESDNEIDRVIKYTFNHLFVTLEEFREASIYNISYYTIEDSLKMFLEKYESLKNSCLINCEEKEDTLYILETCLKLIRNPLNDDIHSNSLPLYDNDVYNVPGKLLYFFICYGYDVVKGLSNDESSAYKMLLNPALEGTLSLSKLLSSEEYPADRLSIVNFPINNFYDIKKSQFMLLHECSHYVGGEWREREIRLKHIAKAIAKIIAIRLVKCFTKEVAEYSVRFNSEDLKLSDYLLKYELNDLTKTIYDRLRKKIDATICCKKDDVKEDKYYNSVSIQRIVGEAVTSVINELELNDILYNIQEVITDFALNKNTVCSLSDIYNKVTKVHNEFVIICQGLLDISNYSLSIIYSLNNIILETRETYADLTACKLLDIQFEDYLEYMMKDIENTKTLMLNEILNRIALISLLYDENCNFNNEQVNINNKEAADRALLNKLEKIDLEENFISSLMDVRISIRDDLYEHTCDTEEGPSLNRSRLFQSSYVSAEVEIYKYLRECNKKIKKDVKLSKMYKEAENDDNLYEVILRIHEYLYEWEKSNIAQHQDNKT